MATDQNGLGRLCCADRWRGRSFFIQNQRDTRRAVANFSLFLPTSRSTGSSCGLHRINASRCLQGDAPFIIYEDISIYMHVVLRQFAGKPKQRIYPTPSQPGSSIDKQEGSTARTVQKTIRKLSMPQHLNMLRFLGRFDGCRAV